MFPQEIEQRILEVLAEETTALRLSERLFAPDGLFSLCASTKAERILLVQTSLFKRAQQQFRELQFNEMDRFSKQVTDFRANATKVKDGPIKTT